MYLTNVLDSQRLYMKMDTKTGDKNKRQKEAC